MRKLYLFLTMMLVAAGAWSQTTYTWQPGAGGSWATSTNWSPTRTVLAASDVLVIGTGTTMTITNVPAQTIGRLVIQKNGVQNTSVTFTATGANTVTIGGGTGTDFTIEAGSQMTMGTNVNVTFATATVTATIDGTLVVNSGRTLDVNNAGNAVTVNGILQNSGTVSGTTTTLTFASGGKYLHPVNAGTVPTATWNSASTCEITGTTTTEPGGLNQTFGNFTWDCASQAANQLQLPGSGFTANGLFKVVNTGTGGVSGGRLELGQTTTTVGSFEISGGTLRIGSNTDRTLTVTGGVTISGGTLLMSTGAAGADVGTLNVAGNFTQSGTSTITESNAGSGLINFNGTSVFSKTAGSTISNEIDVAIASGATVDFGTSVLNGSTGTFTLNATGKMITANAGGIPSTITVTGTKTYSSGADYQFGGAATGTFTTTPTASTARNITINNTTGNVTLSQPMAVTGALTLTDGELNTTSTNLITINDNATVSGASDLSFVNGPVRKVGNDAFTFPIGRNGAGYVPVSIVDNNAGASNTFTAEYFRGTPPNNTNIAAIAGVNHISYCDYWSVDRTVTGDIIDVVFNWNSNNVCGGINYVTDPSTMKVVHYNGSQWDMSSPGGGTGTAAAGSITWTSLNNYSLFALGSTSGSSNPLPVLFDNVKAYTKNDGVQIEWSNLTERDLTKYLVERSANGRDFYGIGEYAPKSNQNDRADYTSFDASPLSGANFYRIKVLEVNGKIIYSKTLRVETNVKHTAFSVYPNPVKGNQVTIALTGVKQGQYNVRMINATGQNVYSKVIVNQSTGLTQTLELPTVKPGVYTMLINGEGFQQSQLVVIQ